MCHTSLDGYFWIKFIKVSYVREVQRKQKQYAVDGHRPFLFEEFQNMLVKCSGALIDRQTAIYLIVLVLRERLVLAEFFITKKKACKQRPPFINSLILCVDLFWVYLVLIFWGFSSLVSVLDETLSIATKQGVQCNTWRIK